MKKQKLYGIIAAKQLLKENHLMSIAESINLLGRFCGRRDVPVLSPEALQEKYGVPQADVMVLFGGSILCGGDVLARAMKDRTAKVYVIVGGEGHTTEALRRKVQELFPDFSTAGLPEAEVFQGYLERRYGLHADHLECRSTNCGNNITHLLALLEERRIPCRHIILTQDATMQRRMDAGLRKYSDMTITNFAAYQAEILETEKGLRYRQDIPGMWSMERYIRLLMGEIPRLTDNEDGYGPKGKNFIAHVEIPPEVEAAFRVLKEEYGAQVRTADPRYATAAMEREEHKNV